MSAIDQMVSASPAHGSPHVEVCMVNGVLAELPNKSADIRTIKLSLDEAQDFYEELGGAITAQRNTPDFEPADAREEALDLRNIA